ncbi:class I SAM-dependent methyltransferase [Saccharomonospora piscinae]|uniref:class I SAM-dependent methyltransferase n=1 Tax=Saccharomonospora piscinae TaxID=687388 RepID=UPI0005626D05|nr:methyltransferase domain-containing protein [Saccharomonospora piscinae]
MVFFPPTTPTSPPRASRAVSVFVSAAVRSPRLLGAVAPSSAALGTVLASVVPTQGAPTVAELGAGTGAVTAQVMRRLPTGGRHLAVEIDPVLAEHVRSQHPAVTVVDGDAADLTELLAEQGVDQVDAVVSGLPWSLFPVATQQRILREVTRSLAPDGAFSTFAYRHAAPLSGAVRFRGLLERLFDEVVVTRTVWRNLPPAHAYVCRRPRAVTEP